MCVALIAGVCAVPIALGASADAATFPVTNTNDAGPGSLRDAIAQANASPGGDIVTIPAGTYALTSGYIDISDDVQISGAGAATTTLSGSNLSRIFRLMDQVPAYTVGISGLTFTEGSAVAPQQNVSGGAILGGTVGSLVVDQTVFSGNKAESGGAITTQAPLVVTASTFSGNTAVNSGDIGAIEVSGPSQGTPIAASITDSTFSGNISSSLYAVVSAVATTLTVTNSTFTGNSAAIAGGGVVAIGPNSTGDLRYVTIAANVFTANPPVSAGIYVAGQTASATIQNSLLIGNTLNGTPANCGTNGGGTLTSAGGNLSDDGSCAAFFNQGTDLNSNTGTTLGPLADNTGPTQTMALVAGSSALDVAPCLQSVTVDQRGITRPQGTGCDIGAFELQVAPPATSSTSTSTSSTLAPNSTASSTTAAAGANSGGNSGAASGSTGTLPVSGNNPTPLIVLAVLLMVGGATFMLAARRRRAA